MSDEAPSLLYMPAAEVEAIAATLELQDFDSGARIRWRPSETQRRCWQAREQHQHLFVTKPRRAYVSTAFDLDDVLFTVINDGAGERVRTGVALDTDDKVAERVFQMAWFLTQLGVPHHEKEGEITLNAHGSVIKVFTAGGRRAAASTGFQRMRYSEAAYYKAGQIGTISAAVGKQADEIIETTIGSHAENFVETRTRWWATGAWHPYHKLFLPFELHAEYRAPAELLTDDEWEWAQGEGFTIKEAAAYFLKVVLPKFGEDKVRALGEYPQTESHMFALATGLFIRTAPEVDRPVAYVDVLGGDGDTHRALIFVPAKDGSGQYLIGVDTSAGAQLSRSCVVVIDRKDGRLMASWASDTAHTDDVALVALELQEQYSQKGARRPELIAHAVIEQNGIGEATCQAAQRLGLRFERLNQTDEGRYQGLLAAKRAVESGVLRGPSELAEECLELRRDEHGRWKGRKDMLMAYGFAARKLAAMPFVDNTWKDKRKGLKHIHVDRFLKEQRQLNRMRGMMPKPPRI